MTAEAEVWTQDALFSEVQPEISPLQDSLFDEWTRDYLAASPHHPLVQEAVEDPTIAALLYTDYLMGPDLWREWEWDGELPLSNRAVQHVIAAPWFYSRDTVQIARAQAMSAINHPPDSTYRQTSEG